ncbi:MAG: hypothetical protein AAF570_01125 [Bacteroidota bacterium]
MKLHLIRMGCVFFLAVSLLHSCKEPDIKLVNKVKNFEPRWATLSEKMSYLDRNLSMAEKRFEKDFGELEGMLGTIPDSLRGRKYRGMLKEYDLLIVDRDTMRTLYDSNKTVYVATVEEFNDWEKKVMNADIETEAGLATLKDYRKIQKSIQADTDSMTTKLEALFQSHNTILREISRMMEVFTNYDIKMQ